MAVVGIMVILATLFADSFICTASLFRLQELFHLQIYISVFLEVRSNLESSTLLTSFMVDGVDCLCIFFSNLGTSTSYCSGRFDKIWIIKSTSVISGLFGIEMMIV